MSIPKTQKTASKNDSGKNIAPKPEALSKSITGYPTEWINNFGSGFYQQQKEKESRRLLHGDWKSTAPGIPYKEPELNTTRPEEVARTISAIINEMKQETNDESS